jgi:hypothetical protein
MLPKRLKAGRRIGTYKEACFLFSALPGQDHRVQSRRNLQSRVKNIRKWLRSLDGVAIKLKVSRHGCSKQVNFAARIRRVVSGTKNLPIVTVCRQHHYKDKKWLGNKTQNDNLRLN